ERITTYYGEEKVLDRISFSVKKGDVAAIIGPNGSGKTTLVKVIVGLITPQNGRVQLFGKKPQSLHGRIGYVPQRFTFDRHFPILVDEYLNLARAQRTNTKALQKAISEVGLQPSILHERIGTLSGGQLQRILIAQAILNTPDILILDEPSTGIDIVGEAVFYEILKHLNEEHGTTIIMVSHDVSRIANIVTKVICLNKKLICAGPPRQALTEKRLKELYGPHTNHHEHH
ncbi:MAG: metal ABC transporter ATP-binding protein, partial [bacterium]|nr:metal ABC transporter ATP-binding protein [bacterium]